MIKKALSLAMLVCAVFGMYAQQMPQLTPLPLNPKVKSGKLPNGLTYFLMHNEEPKERANFYIAQKVGSTLETPEQLGLAHFLEHMAFNGTTHFPGKSMLNYLQSKGIRFGYDINAYTSFDETVYNINNIPTTDAALMDSCLLVLSDWSGSILLEESEINAERGVIQEEWRQRNDAQTRMFTNILPQLYQEYQYQQMPIGKMEVVMNFPPQAIRDYYHKWYRPDQQGIVIVGDFDVAEMEKKVIDLFSQIPMPENAAERTYPYVSNNTDPIYVDYLDSELTYYRATISFKYDKIPVEFRSTEEMYVNEYVVKRLLTNMLNSRLSEYGQKPECPYSVAGCYFGDYYISSGKGAFNIGVVAKSDIKEALSAAMAVIAQACKTGFTDSELERASTQILSSYEKMFNERDKTNTGSLAEEIINYFVNGVPSPGIEKEYEIIQKWMPLIPVVAINEYAKTILTPENQVIVICQPDGEEMKVYSKEIITSTINDAINAQYDAYVDEVITEPLIAKMPKAGKIKNTSENAEFGATEFTLSNGARVIVKTTDFNNDQILFTAIRDGGKQTYAQSQAPNVLMMENVFDMCKWGSFTPVKLQKYLTGKQLALGYKLGNYTNSLEGFSSVKDLPTLMELIYTAFTALTPDQETYDAQKSRLASALALQANNPQKIFSEKMNATIFGNNALAMPLDLAAVEANNYEQTLAMINETFANAADYTFIFTGNVDMETIKKLMCQYIAPLKGNAKNVGKVNVVTSMDRVTGKVENFFTQPMQTPSTNVVNVYSGNLKFTVLDNYMVTFLSDILEMIYTETLREEEGGTYGASVGAGVNPVNNSWSIAYQFLTNKGQQDQLMKRAYDELMLLMSNGADPDKFNKVKEAALKQLDLNERTNNYWLDALSMYCRGYNTIKDQRKVIESITLEQLNAFMKNLYNGQNRIQVVMEGVEIK